MKVLLEFEIKDTVTLIDENELTEYYDGSWLELYQEMLKEGVGEFASWFDSVKVVEVDDSE